MASSSPQRRQPHLRFITDLSQCLFDFVIQLLPPNDELSIKEDVRKLLERLIRTIEPGSRLLAFGSTANGFSLRNSDMDLCCLIDSGERLNASDLVTMLADVLERETKFHVKPLPHARIPIVKLSLDPAPGLPFGISCDIGFENRLAIENTRLLYSYAKIDPTRVRTMVLFLKIWSKRSLRRKINSPYKGTLSSYGYVLLVIYFLVHVKNPPVLPNLQQMPPLRPINKEETTLNGYNVWFFDDTDLLTQRWHSDNSETVAELLIDFFRYFSRDFLYNTGVASIRCGLMKKETKGWGPSGPDKYADSAANERNRLCIEDPFETDYNVARCVTKDGLYTIRGEFMRASRILAIRPERAIIALAELCEERKVEDLVLAPSSRSSARRIHGPPAHNHVPMGGMGGTEEKFFEPRPAVSMPLIIRNPHEQKEKLPESQAVKEKTEAPPPAQNGAEKEKDLPPKSRSPSPSRTVSSPPPPPTDPPIERSTASTSTMITRPSESPHTSSPSHSPPPLQPSPPPPPQQPSLTSPASDSSPSSQATSSAPHQSLLPSIPALFRPASPTTPTIATTTTNTNNNIPPLPQLPIPHHSDSPHTHTNAHSRHNSLTQTLPPPPTIASHTHMLPKRSKWTSPPPPDASFDDRTLYESQLDRSLELGTRRGGSVGGSGEVHRTPSMFSSGSGFGGHGYGYGQGHGRGWSGRGRRRDVGHTSAAAVVLEGGVDVEGNVWENESESVNGEGRDREVERGRRREVGEGRGVVEGGGEMFEDDVDSLLGDTFRPRTRPPPSSSSSQRDAEIEGEDEGSEFGGSATSGHSQRHQHYHQHYHQPAFGGFAWGAYGYGYPYGYGYGYNTGFGAGQGVVNLGSPPSSSSTHITRRSGSNGGGLANGLTASAAEEENTNASTPNGSPKRKSRVHENEREYGHEYLTPSSPATNATSSSSTATLVASISTPPASTPTLPSTSSATAVSSSGTNGSNAGSVTSSPRSEGYVGGISLHHQHLHPPYHPLHSYANANANVLSGGSGGLYRRSSSHSQLQRISSGSSIGGHDRGVYYPLPQSPRHQQQQQQWMGHSPLLSTSSPEVSIESSPRLSGHRSSFVVQSPPRMSGVYSRHHPHYSRVASGHVGVPGVEGLSEAQQQQQVFYQTGGATAGASGSGTRSPRLSGYATHERGGGSGDASPGGGMSPLLAQYQAQLVQLQQLQALHERQLALAQQQQQQQVQVQVQERGDNNVLSESLASLGMRGGGLSGRVGLGTPPSVSFVPGCLVEAGGGGGSRSGSRNQNGERNGREVSPPPVLRADMGGLKRSTAVDSSATTNGTTTTTSSPSLAVNIPNHNNTTTQAPTPVRLHRSGNSSRTGSRTGSRMSSPVSSSVGVGVWKGGVTREEEERFHAMTRAAAAAALASANAGDPGVTESSDTRNQDRSKDAGAEGSKNAGAGATLAVPSSSASGAGKGNVKSGGKRDKSSEKGGGGGRKREKSPMKNAVTSSSASAGKREKSSDAKGAAGPSGANGSVAGPSANGKASGGGGGGGASANGVASGKASASGAGAGNGKAAGSGGSGNGKATGGGTGAGASGNGKATGGAGAGAGAAAGAANAGGGKGKQKQKQKRRNATPNTNGVKPDATKSTGKSKKDSTTASTSAGKSSTTTKSSSS
ncbi:hypothetical protein D9756_007849 [Leucocoprinus leucothites]|uniref:polynucleotide adenylyltransferase n=1 Tax=Leucocoprinus leucothites TaxID=201217 RepID=A0A8H5D583_9AGAR|nr:hypothetical protein D9756_007849 [Leucoagaricus leucothites]